MPDPQVDRVEDEVAPVVSGLGLDLEAVELSRSGSKRLLRVAVDEDGGVSIDRIAEATRALTAALDAGDAMGAQPYTLEVTSRGLDRPLTLARHWRRNVGRLVRVALHEGPSIKGRIDDVDETGAELVVGQERRRVEYDEVARATITPELNRPKDA